MADHVEKIVLVSFKGRKRTVRFISTGQGDSDAILKVFFETFRDQLKSAAVAKPGFFLQVKDEEWSGEFVDVDPTQEVPDRSILQVKEEICNANTSVDTCANTCALNSDDGCLNPLPDDTYLPVSSSQLRLSLSSDGISLVRPSHQQAENVSGPTDASSSTPEETQHFLRKHAHFYGCKSSKPLTPYQQKINLASEELVMSDPSLLDKRENLLRLSRAKVNKDGYIYKKGKSRSKLFSNPEDCNPKKAKRPKTTEYIRTQRMLYLEENLKDIQKQIEFKELRQQQATSSHKYQLCDSITKEITTLKQQRFKEQMELKTLERKQQQSRWYRKGKNKTADCDESNSSTSTASSFGRSVRSHSQSVKQQHLSKVSEKSESLEQEVSDSEEGSDLDHVSESDAVDLCTSEQSDNESEQD